MVTTKKCRTCGEEKPLDEFRIRGDSGKRRTECKSCSSKYLKKYRSKNKQRISELNKRWRNEHKNKLSEYQLNWQRSNRVKCRAYNKKSSQNMTEEQKARRRELERKYREIWNQNPDYVEKRRAWNRESTKRRRKKITAYEEDRKKIDPVFKLKKQIRNEIRMSFNRRGFRKSARTEEIVGCTRDFFVKYLKQTWLDEYGVEWTGQPCHIDHIVPLATAKKEEDIVHLCHYTNLRLLTPKDNMEKSDKLITKEEA